jgi:hypothetical protein
MLNRKTKEMYRLSDVEVVVAFTSKKRLSEMFALYMLNPVVSQTPAIPELLKKKYYAEAQQQYAKYIDNRLYEDWVFVRDNIDIDVECDECRGAYYDKDSDEWHIHEDHYDDGDFCGGCHNEGVDYGGAYRDVYYARLSLKDISWEEYEEGVLYILELCDKLQDPDNPQPYAYKFMRDGWDTQNKLEIKCKANNEESSMYNAPYLKGFVDNLLVTEERIRTNDEGKILEDIEKGEE